MIGEALRLLRVFHDMKSVELAQKLELSTSYISEIESGKKQPSLEILQKYAVVFQTTPSAILLMSEGLEKEPQGFKAKISKFFMQFLQEIEENKVV